MSSLEKPVGLSSLVGGRTERTDANVFVDCRTRQDWHPIRYGDVAFPLLLLAIAHVMIEEDNRLNPVEALRYE